MKKTLKALLAGATLALASVSASAAVWTSTYDPNPDQPVPPSRTWVHDLTTDGFNMATDDIDWFDLNVHVYDDNGGDRALEWAKVQVNDSIYWGTSLFSLSTISVDGFDFFGTLNFLQDGKMSVTLSALAGDFMFAKSVLTAGGTSRSVPEPASLALLGLGLAGLAFARRRQQKA